MASTFEVYLFWWHNLTKQKHEVFWKCARFRSMLGWSLEGRKGKEIERKEKKRRERKEK